METVGSILIFVLLGWLGWKFLKWFDRVSGRGSKQVKDGVEAADSGGRSGSGSGEDRERREPCPYCAEAIKPAAKVCRYCDRELPEGWAGA